MKITRRQLRQIIKEEIGQLVVVSRMRGQNDSAGYTSGLYEDDEDDDIKHLGNKDPDLSHNIEQGT